VSIYRNSDKHAYPLDVPKPALVKTRKAPGFLETLLACVVVFFALLVGTFRNGDA